VIGNVVKDDSDFGSAVCRPPAGTPDYYQTGFCNCWSGFAPSDDTATDCNSRAKCAQQIQSSLDQFANDSPNPPTTVFDNDQLTITQSVPIVQQRRGSFISFAVPLLNNTLPDVDAGTEGALTCNYPGPLWTKTINALDCTEQFQAVMPWSQNQFCGFVQDITTPSISTVIYRTVLVTRFIEIYKFEGKLTQRLSQFAYQVSVSFLAQKVFSSSPVSVWIEDSSVSNFVKVAVTADAVYDVASGNVLVTYLTSTAWPYMLNTDTSSFVSSSPVLSVGVEIANVEYSYGTKKCDSQQDSDCTQKWYVRINTGSNCDISGTYTFQDALWCRDVNSSISYDDCLASTQPVTYNLRIKKTDLCAPAQALDATQDLTAVLSSYVDPARQSAADTFQTGDIIYWDLVITNPQASIDEIEFYQIALDIGGPSDVLLDASNFTEVGVATQLTISEITSVVFAGDSATLTFSYQYLRPALPNTVGTLDTDNLSVNVRTTVIVDIWYHGNQKRTIELSGAPTQASQYKNVRVIENETTETTEPDTEAEEQLASDNSASSMAASVILVVIALICQLM
jgi:hypothetical protein